MKVSPFPVAFLTIFSTVSFAQSAVSTEPATVTHTQAKALARSAKTPAEYSSLRNYYFHLAQKESLKAAEEKQEWDRRAANPTVYA